MTEKRSADATNESLRKRLLSRADAAENMILRVGGSMTDAGRTFFVDAKLFRDAAEALSRAEETSSHLAKAYVAERDVLLAARSETVLPVPAEQIDRMLDNLQTQHVAVTKGTGYDPERYSSGYSEAADMIRRLRAAPSAIEAHTAELADALRLAINSVECASIDPRSGEELPWYRAAKKALAGIAQRGLGYMGDVNGTGCDPDVP